MAAEETVPVPCACVLPNLFGPVSLWETADGGIDVLGEPANVGNRFIRLVLVKLLPSERQQREGIRVLSANSNLSRSLINLIPGNYPAASRFLLPTPVQIELTKFHYPRGYHKKTLK